MVFACPISAVAERVSVAVRERSREERQAASISYHVPPPHGLLVGRDDLLDDTIDRLLSGDSLALSAEGLPGVGKTTLAVSIAHHPRVREHFRHGVLWAGLGPTPDVMGLLAGWAEALGGDITQLSMEGERSQALSDALADRSMLLVLDDAWDDESANYLKCGGPNCRHLLTTRNQSIASRFATPTGVVNVPVLKDDTSNKLLEALAPEAFAADPEAARGLARVVGGLPLAGAVGRIPGFAREKLLSRASGRGIGRAWRSFGSTGAGPGEAGCFNIGRGDVAEDYRDESGGSARGCGRGLPVPGSICSAA